MTDKAERKAARIAAQDRMFDALARSVAESAQMREEIRRLGTALAGLAEVLKTQVNGINALISTLAKK